MKWLVKSGKTRNYLHAVSFANKIDSMWSSRQTKAVRFNTPDDARGWIKDFGAYYTKSSASDLRVMRVRK